ncbi:MAG: AcvB/VirJ family lysyl-phosphatidylglycerol hydrolase [Candidatus Binataceae bacterium]
MKLTMLSWHAAALVLVLCCFGASLAYAVDGGPFGQVKVVEPRGQAHALVIFFSDRDGLTAQDDAAAQALAKAGALVAEVDTPASLTRLDKSSEHCHKLVFDAEWLSHGLQREHKFPRYLTPILAGVGEGGTLAELILSEAPAVTIAGAVSVDPSATVTSRLPICTGVSAQPGRAGFRYGAAKKLPGYWIVGLTPKVSKSSRDYILALRRGGAPLELHENGPNSTSADALRALIQPHLAMPLQGVGDISRLPLTQLPVKQPSEFMAIELSGDGGWRDLDKTIAEDLQRQGLPVVGWDSLRYFWSKKTPEQTASDLGAVIETFVNRWHADKVALIGYSFGADVLPVAYNRLPETLRSHVSLIALLGLSKSADFEIRVSGWLGLAPGPDAIATAPELRRISPQLMQCFYGQNEQDSACPGLAREGVEVIRTSGGHHFGGNYEALADRILTGFRRRATESSRAAR